MVADILMALIVSLCLELFSSMGKIMKHILIAVCCVTLIITYFCTGNTINFIGTMDFSVWILFVVVFNLILGLLEKQFVRFFKNKEKQCETH